MAITICSSSNHSPTLPTVSLSSVPTISSLRTLHPLQPPPSLSSTTTSYSSSPSKFGLSLVSDDALTVAVAAEVESLVSATAWVAASSASKVDEISLYRECEDELEGGWNNVSGVRRKKRRKRRKAMECSETEKNSSGEYQLVSFRSTKSGYLTPKEEAEFSMCLKEGARLEAARRRMAETREQEPTSNQLAEAVGMSRRSLDKKLCNGRESRERITRSYRRLVVSIASCYQGKGLSLQDLIQEGSIGLLRGAERFDPDRGYKLSTYVYWWIRQAIIRAIANKSRTIRLPGSICGMVAKIAEANTILSKRLRRPPTYDEIAEVLDVEVSTVRLVSERSRAPISVDRAVTSRGCMTLQDIIPGPDETTPETMVKKQLIKLEVEKLLKVLCDREAHILRLHFGLNGETPRSFEEIGRLLRLSRERVRQINHIALSKLLQQTSIVDNLKLYMS